MGGCCSTSRARAVSSFMLRTGYVGAARWLLYLNCIPPMGRSLGYNRPRLVPSGRAVCAHAGTLLTQDPWVLSWSVNFARHLTPDGGCVEPPSSPLPRSRHYELSRLYFGCIMNSRVRACTHLKNSCSHARRPRRARAAHQSECDHRIRVSPRNPSYGTSLATMSWLVGRSSPYARCLRSDDHWVLWRTFLPP